MPLSSSQSQSAVSRPRSPFRKDTLHLSLHVAGANPNQIIIGGLFGGNYTDCVTLYFLYSSSFPGTRVRATTHDSETHKKNNSEFQSWMSKCQNLKARRRNHFFISSFMSPIEKPRISHCSIVIWYLIFKFRCAVEGTRAHTENVHVTLEALPDVFLSAMECVEQASWCCKVQLKDFVDPAAAAQDALSQPGCGSGDQKPIITRCKIGIGQADPILSRIASCSYMNLWLYDNITS